MAKIVAPPAINDLDGILDLLLHPEKYVKYLQDLKAMHSAVVESIGTLKTKDEADALLASAQTKVQQANERLAEATTAAKDAADQIDRTRKATEREIQLAKDTITQTQRRLAAKEAELMAKEAGLTEEARKQAARAQELAGQCIVIKSREDYLEQEEAKLKHLKSLMASHGV